ncbi:MAG TPA: pilus assembly protein PilN [Sedimenticola thiotaurini]|uniref:Pilus assembly protein PilN n=1 Tax=Sedimenticola thiotaurini TaxID=1543721 RepID=A0A831RMF1_9GAMM|nr:pilus assembly protein PilN [Sedimenticola thiotaurini]
MARINLLPWRENLRKKKQRDFGIAALTMVAIVGLGCAAVHFYIEGQIEFQNQRNAYLKKEIAAMDKKIREIKDLEKTKARLIARMNVIQQLQGSRPQIVHLFDEVVNTIPEGAYLTKLEQRGRKLTLTGLAQSNARISSYMRNIDKSDWIDKPVLQVISNEGKGAEGLAKFTLDAVEIAPKEQKEGGDQ